VEKEPSIIVFYTPNKWFNPLHQVTIFTSMTRCSNAIQ